MNFALIKEFNSCKAKDFLNESNLEGLLVIIYDVLLLEILFNSKINHIKLFSFITFMNSAETIKSELLKIFFGLKDYSAKLLAVMSFKKCSTKEVK